MCIYIYIYVYALREPLTCDTGESLVAAASVLRVHVTDLSHSRSQFDV